MLTREQKEMIWIIATAAAVLFLVALGNINVTLPDWSWSFDRGETVPLLDVQPVSVPEDLKRIGPLTVPKVVNPPETVQDLAAAEDLVLPVTHGTEAYPDLILRWMMIQERAQARVRLEELQVLAAAEDMMTPYVPGTSGADAAEVYPDLILRWMMAQEAARERARRVELQALSQDYQVGVPFLTNQERVRRAELQALSRNYQIGLPIFTDRVLRAPVIAAGNPDFHVGLPIITEMSMRERALYAELGAAFHVGLPVTTGIDLKERTLPAADPAAVPAAVPEYVYLLERLGASDWLPRDPSIIWVEATAAPTTSSEPTSRVRSWLPAAMRGEATAKWTTLPVDELSLVP